MPAVRELLKDESAEIRVQAIEVLSQSAPRDARLLADLTAMLDDADARVQRQSIDTIRILGPLGRQSLPVVIGKLNSPSPEVRLAAVGVDRESRPGCDRGHTRAHRVAGRSDAEDPDDRRANPGKDGKGGTTRVRPVDFAPGSRASRGPGSRHDDAGQPGTRRRRPSGPTWPGRSGTRTPRSVARPRGRSSDSAPTARSSSPTSSCWPRRRRISGRPSDCCDGSRRRGPDVRSLPELVKQLGHKQDSVRLLAIKFLGLAGRNAKEALPALERMRERSRRRGPQAGRGRLRTDQEPVVGRPTTRRGHRGGFDEADLEMRSLDLCGQGSRGRRKPISRSRSEEDAS